MSRRVPQTASFSKTWIPAALVLGAVMLCSTGCSPINLRGESFARDETFDWTHKTRSADGGIECFGFSNKAREIEQGCGAR